MFAFYYSINSDLPIPIYVARLKCMYNNNRPLLLKRKAKVKS